MNTFNKLYNLILQNIISQNKASRAQLLAGIQNSQAIQQYLNTLDNKVADFLAKFFKTGQLTDTTDKRIQQVINILQRNTSFNTQTKISLEQFLKQNEQYANRAQAKKDNYLDSIKQLSQKKEYPNGVVIYRVDESQAGHDVVRKIVDAQWGEDASPWCLISRNVKKNGLEYWNRYNAYPKHIAFQNGKLLAFCANSDKHVKWWDRNDHSSSELKLLDGSYMQTDYYGFTKEQQEEMKRDQFKKWLIENDIHLNLQTGRYDSDGDVYIPQKIFELGKFPIKFGVINGNLSLSDYHASSFEYAPTLVKGNLHLGYSNDITSLKGLENTIVEGEFHVSSNNLQSLKYAPKLVKGDFSGNGMQNLKDLDHFWERVQGKFECVNCPSLSPEDQIRVIALQYKLVYNKATGRYDSPGDVKTWAVHMKNEELRIPLGVINGNFECHYADVKSLKNFPTQVTGDFELRDISELRTLKGMPKHVGGEVRIIRCKNLVTIEDYDVETADGKVIVWGCYDLPTEQILTNFYNRNELHLNKETKRFDAPGNVMVYASDLVNGQVAIPLGVIKGNFEVQENCNSAFVSLRNGPKWVGGNYIISHNPNVKSLQGAPEYVGGSFCISYCYKITSLFGGPEYVGGNYNCNWCHRLQTLQGIPETINGDLFLSNCKSLQNLDYAPKIVKGKVKISGSRFINREQINAYKKQLKERNKKR